MRVPAPGTTDPAAIPIAPKIAAKIALVAAFGSGSPNAKLIPKSTNGPITGILENTLSVNPKILFRNDIFCFGSFGTILCSISAVGSFGFMNPSFVLGTLI